MAAQTSSKRISNYSKVLTKNCSKQSILILVLTGLGAVFGVIQFVLFGSNRINEQFYENSIHFSLAAAISGVLLVPGLFREVYNRQFADVEFSLPMSASERFRSKLTVLLKRHILPFVAAQVIILLTSVIFADWKSSAEYILPNCLRCINFALFTDAVCLLCVSCCGHIVECLYTSVLSVIAFSIFIPLVLIRFFLNMARTTSSLSEKVTAIGVGFPKLALEFVGDVVEGGGDLSHHIETEFSVLEAVMLFVNLAFCVLLIFIAFRIYKKRSGLSAGKPFASKAFYRFFLIFVTLNVILIFFLSSFYLAILVGLIFSLAISIFSKRKKVTLRDIEFSLLGYCATLIFVLIAGFVSYATGAFGLAYSMPGKDFTSENSDLHVRVAGEKGESYRVYLTARSAHDTGYLHDSDEPVVYADRSKIDAAFTEAHDADLRKHSSFADNLSSYSALLRYEKDYVYGDRDWTIYIYCSRIKFNGSIDERNEIFEQTVISGKEECLKFMKAVEDKCGVKFKLEKPVEYYEYYDEVPDEERSDTVSTDESDAGVSEAAQ